MRPNNLARAAALLSTTGLVAAQTVSECDPTAGDECPPNPAFGNCGKEIVYDLSTVAGGDGWKDDDKFTDFWTPDRGIVSDNSPLSINENGAVFTITNDEQAPLIKSNQYLFFGRVEVIAKAAPGVGIVTSVVLESSDRDELDWEWIGGEPGNVQTNFFSKGRNEFIHGQTHAVGFNTMEGLHSYAIDWTPDHMIFYVDGKEIRRATPAEAENGAKWPQTPTQVKLGTWVGGKPSNPQGTIDWAGGLADFSQAPFVAWYKEVRITDYCGGKDKATEYVYGDASGAMDSIQVRGSSSDVGFGDGNDDETTAPATTAGPTASGTSPDEPSETGDGEPESTPDTDPEEGEGGDEGAAAVKGVSSTLAAIVCLGYFLVA